MPNYSQMQAIIWRQVNRRTRLCKQAPRCPKCRTEQVEIIDCSLLAEWKCRHCKHKWKHEPLVVQQGESP